MHVAASGYGELVVGWIDARRVAGSSKAHAMRDLLELHNFSSPTLAYNRLCEWERT